MSTHWERITVLEFDLELTLGYGFRCHFSTSDSIDEFELFIWQSDISLIELISDGSPPIFIFRFFDELGDHIILFLFGDFL